MPYRMSARVHCQIMIGAQSCWQQDFAELMNQGNAVQGKAIQNGSATATENYTFTNLDRVRLWHEICLNYAAAMRCQSVCAVMPSL